MPVPTKGFSVIKVGTACLCIFEPIRALLASSCSKKGITDDATDTICIGDTSIYSIFSGGDIINSFKCLQEIKSSLNLPLLSSSAFACAITYFDSSIADRYSISFVTFKFLTFL